MEVTLSISHHLMEESVPLTEKPAETTGEGEEEEYGTLSRRSYDCWADDEEEEKKKDGYGW